MAEIRKTVYEMERGERVRVKFSDGKFRNCYFCERIWRRGFWRVGYSQKEVVFGGVFVKQEGMNYYVLDL